MPPKSSKLAKRVMTYPTADAVLASGLPKQVQQKTRRRSNRVRSSVRANPYFNSLLLPPISNTKIPDPSCLLTSSASLTYDTSLVGNANGVTGIAINLTGWGGSVAGGGCGILIEGAASTDSSFAYNVAISTPGSTSFDSTFSASRLVSASLEIEYLGSTLNDAGRIYLSSYYGTKYISETVATSASNMLSARDNTSMPLRSGGFVRWKPADDTCDDFTGYNAANVKLGVLQAHITAAAGIPFRVRLVTNYECLASSDTVSFSSPTTSPVDQAQYSEARNLISGVSSFDTFSDLSGMLARGATSYAVTAAYVATSRAIARGTRQRQLMAAPAA